MSVKLFSVQCWSGVFIETGTWGVRANSALMNGKVGR